MNDHFEEKEKELEELSRKEAEKNKEIERLTQEAEKLQKETEKIRRDKHIIIGMILGMLMMCALGLVFDIFNGPIGWITWQM